MSTTHFSLSVFCSYSAPQHNIFCDNCHHHSARALSSMQLGSGSLSRMDMWRAWWIITTRGRYVSVGACLCTYLPLICLAAFLLLVIFLSK